MIIELDSARQEAMAISMARAFQSEPNFEYVLPDPSRRAKVLPWVFRRSVARIAGSLGQAFTTVDGEGGAFWIAPCRRVDFWLAVRAGILGVPFRMGLGGAGRFASLGKRVEEVRKDQLGEEPHWYLMALGVDPSRQHRGIGAALLRPVLDQADRGGAPCYLETFAERNLAFYGRLGFQVCVEDSVPGGPRFWGMIRRPG